MKDKPNLVIWLSGTFIFAFVLIAWGLNWILPDYFFAKDPCNAAEKIGWFGDKFGATNALFSGLAFAVIIISLWDQRREIKQNKKQYEAQRLENQLFTMIKILQDLEKNMQKDEINDFNKALDSLSLTDKNHIYLNIKYICEKNFDREWYEEDAFRTLNELSLCDTVTSIYKKDGYFIFEDTNTKILIHDFKKTVKTDTSSQEILIKKINDIISRKIRSTYYDHCLIHQWAQQFNYIVKHVFLKMDDNELRNYIRALICKEKYLPLLIYSLITPHKTKELFKLLDEETLVSAIALENDLIKYLYADYKKKY